MSSMPDAIEVEQGGDHASRREVIGWIWPAGTRGVLAAVVIASALGLGLAGETLPGPDQNIVPAPDLRLDVNTVPAQVLETLPHVGQSLVRQLVAARDMRPFASLDDAGSRVRGLGPATLAQIAPYLRFETSAQPDVDVADITWVDHRPAKPKPKARKTTARPRKQKLTPPAPRLVSRSL
jgi:hypothetical protein